MKKIEADAYVEGWDAMLMCKPRNANPYRYRGVRRSAWDSYRERAWELGWIKCERGDKFIDPRRRAASRPLPGGDEHVKPCERCGKSAGDGYDLWDYRRECGKDLCEDCMAKGCCGFTPALSGMEPEDENGNLLPDP
jgi:hypothetical protein